MTKNIMEHIRMKRYLNACFAVVVGVILAELIYGYNYLGDSLFDTVLSVIGTVVGSLIVYALFDIVFNHLSLPEVGVDEIQQQTRDIKDKKLIYITIGVFLLSFGVSHYIVDDIKTSGNYGKLNSSILKLNDDKEPLSTAYLDFKKSMDTNDADKLAFYLSHKDDLLSMDSDIVFNFVVLKDTIKNEAVKKKFNDIYSDKYVTINEYKEFKNYVLNNETVDSPLAQLVNR